MKAKFTPPEKPSKFAELLASRVKISAGYASDLANGKRTPSMGKAIEFHRAYGIPLSFWADRTQ